MINALVHRETQDCKIWIWNMIPTINAVVPPGDAKFCVSTLSGSGGGMAERGVCMMCPNVIPVS